jgi:hypothetical protein
VLLLHQHVDAYWLSNTLHEDNHQRSCLLEDGPQCRMVLPHKVFHIERAPQQVLPSRILAPVISGTSRALVFKV